VSESRAGGVETDSEAATEQVGEALARTLAPGTVIHLYGDLGAGKTAFVRGLARALGANPADVTSPTFTIIQEYRDAAPPVYHVDLYRLSPPEIEDLGLDDLIDAGGIVAIEWADRWPGRPAGAREVRIEKLDDERRRIRVAD
jgi:tRNA threonylcarbamoyladenosine biosynthesis protein TsaE